MYFTEEYMIQLKRDMFAMLLCVKIVLKQINSIVCSYLVHLAHLLMMHNMQLAAIPFFLIVQWFSMATIFALLIIGTVR